MSASNWLERLDRATEYYELQVVFSEIVAAARITTDNARLAETIDEAIRRLTQERLRDEQELEDFQREYEAFKQQQSGVVGWFKRHLPFTETRRQELEHRGTVADQQAEILADNLIIARAQIVKEKLLPPERRNLGYEPWQWRKRLDANNSFKQLRDYARVVQELTNELTRSRSFVQQLDEDVEAFAAADFSSKDDRQRKDADLVAARDELAMLQSEVREEDSMRSAAMQQLGKLVTDELSAHDPSFRALCSRLESLDIANREAKEVKSVADELRDDLKRLHDLNKKYQALPKKREDLERKTGKLQRDVDTAERRRAECERELRKHSTKYNEALLAAERAGSATSAAKAVYDAYLEEQQNKAEVDSEAAFGVESSVQNEYLRLRQESDQAQQQLKEATTPYEMAKSQSEDAQRDASDLNRKLDDTRRQQGALADQEKQLRLDLSAASDRLHPAWQSLPQLVDRYLNAIGRLSRQSSLPNLDSFQMPHVPDATARRHTSRFRAANSDTNEALDFADQFVKALRREQKDLEREVASEKEASQEAWKRRCYEVLEKNLADDVCQLATGI